MAEMLSFALNALDLHSPASERRAIERGISSVPSAHKPDPGERKVQAELGVAAIVEGGEGVAYLVGGSEGNPGSCAGVQAQGSGFGTGGFGTGGLQGTHHGSTGVPSEAESASHAYAEDASSFTGARAAKDGQTAHVAWDQVRISARARCVRLQVL